MNEPTTINGKNGLWKNAALVVMTAFATLIVAWLLLPRGLSRTDVEAMIPTLVQTNNPYTRDAEAIKQELQELKEEIRGSRTEGTSQYTHIEDQISQIQGDLARVAAKEGVTAHPGK